MSTIIKIKEGNDSNTLKLNHEKQENANSNTNSKSANFKVAGIEQDDKLNNKQKKQRRRDKSDLGENFIAPDGGFWAWLVCIAAGASNMSVYACSQQFGFLFRERLAVLGLSTSQITTIINSNPAISSCTGLINGPMFRRFSYRQVAIAGSLLVFLGLSLTAFCETFIGYFISFSLIFGFGMGISTSASALAVNTYFKNKRRLATGFSWTITGLGPIFLPHVITFLLTIYTVKETVLIFAAFSLHAFVGALTYQPAQYHSPKPPKITFEIADNPDLEEKLTHNNCSYCDLKQFKERSIFPSQYLYLEDDENMCGYEIIEPATPMLSRANDGWFGSKLSLASRGSTTKFRTIPSSKDLEENLRLPVKNFSENNLIERQFLKPNYFKRERDEAIKRSNSRQKFGTENMSNINNCNCIEENSLMEKQLNDMQEVDENDESELEIDPSKITFWRKVVLFFDLDLLRDFTYVNLVVGLTIIHFGELNFSLLTPFILHDFGFSSKQMTTATSMLASMDLSMRFLVPFITQKISWDNRIFFLIGVLGIALGRTVVACSSSYHVILGSFLVIGFFKGIRTVFWPLIIPSYVPLKRLPAASGLQLLITGVFVLSAGPLVGIVRDRYNYSVAIHCLNFLTFFAAFSWSTEALIRRYLKRRTQNEQKTEKPI